MIQIRETVVFSPVFRLFLTSNGLSWLSSSFHPVMLYIFVIHFKHACTTMDTRMMPVKSLLAAVRIIRVLDQILSTIKKIVEIYQLVAGKEFLNIRRKSGQLSI